MNYDESIAWLESLGQFGIRLGMERIQQLLFVLGHPENQVKTIHVAGTNGKGSVTTMIAAILAEAGLRVGKFTSPHLVRYNERIQINEKDIPDEDFAKVLTTVREFADDLVKKEAGLSLLCPAAGGLRRDRGGAGGLMGFYQFNQASGLRDYQYCPGSYQGVG